MKRVQVVQVVGATVRWGRRGLGAGDALGFNTTALASQPDRRRLRVGDYRFIYTVDSGELIVWVVHVGHRSTVYDT